MHVQSEGQVFRTVWTENFLMRPEVHMIDQARLPLAFETVQPPTVAASCEAIVDMTVRGAGAIGAAAGYAMAQGFSEGTPEEAKAAIENTRPTAQNLFYATKRVFDAAIGSERAVHTAWEEAAKIADQDVFDCKMIGVHGSELLPDDARVVTHCNAGWLAFVDWGTALSPVYESHRAGKKVMVFTDETQPRQQGARLTAWELANEGVDHMIVPDNGIADLMEHEQIDLVIVGADRIAANGDTANKIGTQVVAIVAKRYGVPFYVAAPLATIDTELSDGSLIKIESRDADEVRIKTGRTADGRMESVLVVNPDSPVRNRAFDVTPAELITSIITPQGIIEPTTEAIRTVTATATAA